MTCNVTLENHFGVEAEHLRELDPLSRFRICTQAPLAEDSEAIVEFTMSGKEFKNIIEAVSIIIDSDVPECIATLIQPWTVLNTEELKNL